VGISLVGISLAGKSAKEGNAARAKVYAARDAYGVSYLLEKTIIVARNDQS
jgi:hypothetical protein